MTAVFLQEIIKISGDIWEKGWAERNAGNISVRLKTEEIPTQGVLNLDTAWENLGCSIPEIGNEFFLVSGTGKFIRNIQIAPEKSLGVLQLNETGSQYRIVWGYSDGGRPTSELMAHLQAHAIKKVITNGANRAIIHTHPTNLIALTYALEIDTCSITRLLWEMHAECIVVFPEGIEFLPWMMAGSNKIADATAEAFKKRNLVIWQYHGIFGAGLDLDTAFGLIDTAEKAAEIFIKIASVGGIKNKLPLEKIYSIARNFGAEPAADIVAKLSNRGRVY
jgi:rhamnulose-1-phosphate aldolase